MASKLLNVTNDNNVPALDRIDDVNAAIGTPFHGLIDEGELDLSGSGGPTITGLTNGSTLFNVSLSNPNRTLPVRSGAQITADAAIGRVHRAYALVPNRALFGHDTYNLNIRESVYFDSRGYPWLVDWTDFLIDYNGNQLTGDVKLTRLLHLGLTIGQQAQITESPTLGSAGVPNSTRGPGLSLLTLMDFRRDGQKVLFTDAENRPSAFWEVTISDTINEGAGTYPYNGGTISFQFALNVVRADVDMVGAVAWNNTANWIPKDIDGDDVPDPNAHCTNLAFSGSIGPCFAESEGTPDSFTFSWTDRYYWANYTKAGAIVEWGLDISGTDTREYTHTYPASQPGEIELTRTDIANLVYVLKRNGVAQDSITETMSRNYTGTYHTGTNASSMVWTDTVTIDTAFTQLTGTEGPEFGSDVTMTDIGRPEGQLSAWAGAQKFPGAAGADEGARRVVNLGEEKVDQRILSVGTQMPTPTYFPALDTNDDDIHDIFQVTFSRFNSNKVVSLFSEKRSLQYNPGTLEASLQTTPREIALEDLFSPESSHTPDTTIRALTSGDFGTPAAYDPENNVWTSGTWDGGLARWRRIFYV